MKIKEVAQRLNLSARAIRFYEEKGLFSPGKRDENQYRQFTDTDIWRLQTIAVLREAGMTIEDIKKVFEGAAESDQEQLRYYLEVQRSVLYSQWVELKTSIETTDRMIDLLGKQDSLPLHAIFALAEGSRRLREARKNWQDQWDFDSRASFHDEFVTHNQNEFKDYDLALETARQWTAPEGGEHGLDIGTGTGNLAGRFMVWTSSSILSLAPSHFII